MIFSVSYFIVYFTIFVLMLLFWQFNRKRYPTFSPDGPPVSILIAARNEEHNIITCLEAIEKLNYPKEKIEVLIGNDNSTDQTKELVINWITGKKGYKLIDIERQLGQARGKGNVLAHLTKMASSEYFFITDADIKVPENWIQQLLGFVTDKVAIVTGITTIRGNKFFERMQAIDWLNNIGMMQVVVDLGMPVSTMGNNMLVTRKAYEATGGFENMEFSVTEDIQLFNEVRQKGYGFRNIFDRSVLATSTAQPNLNSLLHQRKRWMKGSMFLPKYMLAILIIYASFYAVWLPFFRFVSLDIFFGIWLTKILLQSIFIVIAHRRLSQPFSVFELLLYEFYLLTTSVLLLFFFFRSDTGKLEREKILIIILSLPMFDF